MPTGSRRSGGEAGGQPLKLAPMGVRRGERELGTFAQNQATAAENWTTHESPFWVASHR